VNLLRLTGTGTVTQILSLLPNKMDKPNNAAGEGGSGLGAKRAVTSQHSARYQEKSLSQRSVSIGSVLANELRNTYLDKRSALSASDNVFMDQGSGVSTPANPAGGTGADFPPAYGVIRASKFKRLNVGKIGAAFGYTRQLQEKIGYPKTGFKSDGDARPMVAQNYHCAQNSVNISVSISRPRGGNDDMSCLACPVEHSFKEKLDAGLPVAFVLADQSFPSVLPAAEGDCVVILRVEDALLGELVEAFADRFKCRLFPHGSLPPGSVILIGSLSHLQARGLADYAEEMVNATNSLINRFGAKVEVIPLVNVPLSGLDNAAVVRSLFDYNSWLTTAALGGHSLPNTRATFWDVIRKEECEWEGGSKDTYTVMLPVSSRNPRKKPFTSESPTQVLPARVGPLSELGEKTIVTALLSEVNSICGLSLDINASTDRSVGPPASHDDCRTVILGASHMSRIATAMSEDGVKVTSLATPGWKPTKENIARAAEFCSAMEPTKNDRFILDLWSNSAFMGTDVAGLPCKVYRDDDGRYHVQGPVQAAPLKVFQVLAAEAIDLIAACGDATVILVAPIPRYVNEGCCEDESHVSNLHTEDSNAEMIKAINHARAAAGSDESYIRCKVYNITDTFSYDKDFSSMVTAGGLPIWQEEDPVHLTPEAYIEIADSLRTFGEDDLHGSRKRARLESVIPGAGPPNKKRGPPIKPAPWVAGLGPADNRGGRGRGGARGGWRPRGFRGSRGGRGTGGSGAGRRGWRGGWR
jgi:hypothetical protein